jgi:hypothetical protein
MKEALLILLLLLSAWAAHTIINRSTQHATHALISIHNETEIILCLSQDMVFTLPQNPHIQFQIKNGAIAFISSNCPDYICIRTGFIHLTGQTAACLPNRMLVTLR